MNVWLMFCTFMLCILGMSLTRAGIANSVHAFAESQVQIAFAKQQRRP